MIKKRRLISTFKKLVKIDSLSLFEGKIAKYLQKEMRLLGIPLREAGVPREGEVGNLVAFLPGKGINSPQLLLNAHIDTVGPGKKIKPTEKNGYLFSDGETILGADNKAGVAAILEILKVIKEKKLNHPPLRIIFTVAEEIGLVGAKVLPEKIMNADYGFTLDGGDIDQVINQAPAQYNLSATIIGKSAHAGLHPEDGINAIKVASAAISNMKLGRIDHETTANIGIIKGGKATNIIPDEVELKGEARSHNTRKLEKQVEHMEQALFRACRKYQARLQLKVERVYKSFKIDPKDKTLALVLSALKECRIVPKVEKTGGGSDANIFNEWGIPTLILGVGADRVHTTKEQLSVEDFTKGTEIVLKIITEVEAWKKLGTQQLLVRKKK